MILQVFSSDAAIRANSCSNGAIKALFLGAMFKFARVRAANFEIFSSFDVKLPVAIRPMSLSMHRCWLAIFSLSSELVSRSLIVHRISRQPSRVSKLELTNRFTRF